MPSPFPGMDPYLEQEGIWHDFHERFINAASEALAAEVGPTYLVRLEEQLYIHELPDSERRLLGRGDVTIRSRSDQPHAAATVVASAASAAPVYIDCLPGVDFERDSYIEIRDKLERRVVTVIELLSPSNKRSGADRDQYMAKRRRLLHGDANFVEIDLLRGGWRTQPDDLPTCDYCVIVRRAEEWTRLGVWPLGLRDPLPTIPIPLRPPDPDAHLNLAQLLNRVYDIANYAADIYHGAPHPPLNPRDAAWARELIAR